MLESLRELGGLAVGGREVLPPGHGNREATLSPVSMASSRDNFSLVPDNFSLLETSTVQSEAASVVESEPNSLHPSDVGGEIFLSHMVLLPSQENADGAHASFTVTNTTSESVRLLPTSDLPLLVHTIRSAPVGLSW